MEPKFTQIDPDTLCAYVDVPASLIVVFKALIDTLDGIALTRTYDKENYTVAVYTTPELKEHCRQLLISIYPVVPWMVSNSISKEALL